MPPVIIYIDHLSTKPKMMLLSNLPGSTFLIALWIAWVRGFTSNKCLNDFHWIPLWGFKSIIVFKNGRAYIRENNWRLLNLPGLLLIRFSFAMCVEINFLIKFLNFLPGIAGWPRQHSFPESLYLLIFSCASSSEVCQALGSYCVFSKFHHGFEWWEPETPYLCVRTEF